MSAKSITLIEDVPMETAVSASETMLGRGLFQLSAHTGSPPQLCDIVFMGCSHTLESMSEQTCVQPRDVMRKPYELGCRSLVVGVVPCPPGESSYGLIKSSEHAFAAGADIIEIDAGDSDKQLTTVAVAVSHLHDEEIPVFVTGGQNTVVAATAAGACGIGGSTDIQPAWLDHDVAIIITRTSAIIGTDPLIVVYQVVASLSRLIARFKHAGFSADKIIIDPVLDRNMLPGHAAIVRDHIHHLRSFEYPLITGPRRNAGDRSQSLFDLASDQLRLMFSGVEFIRACGEVEMRQAIALADRLRPGVA